MWMPLLRAELYKIFKKPRTYLGFGVIAAVTLVIQLAMYANGQSFVDFVLQGIQEQFDVEGNILNGYLVTYIILNLLLAQVPLLVALVAGDALAGEAGAGTLRLLLTRPIGRTRLVLAKFTASSIYAILLLLWLAVIGLGLSLLVFGRGDMLNFTADRLIMLLSDDIFWRYLGAFGFAALALITISTLALFFSAMAANAIGPIVSTMGVIILMTIITNLELPLFQAIKPFLFTTHMVAWKGFFNEPVPYGAMLQSALIMLAYILVLLGATIFVFKRKDIQT